MRKKYNIRKKKRLVSSYKILSIIICILLLIAVGYSISTTTLTIIAKVNLNKKDIDLPSKKSNSSATWEIKTEPWGNEFTAYNISFELENKDENVDTWTISMDFPPCVLKEGMEVWGASSYKIERVGDYDRITFIPMDWDAKINLGEKLDKLGFNIRLSGKTNMNIDHLIFNDRLVTDFKQIGTIYDVSGGEVTNEITNTIVNEITNETTNTTTNETTNTTTNETGGETGETGNSKATWNIVNSWGTTHQVKVNIENNDKACTSWTLSIDVPQGIDENSITSWSSSVKVERIGNYDRVTFTSQSYNGNVELGQTASIEFQINYSDKIDFNIYKVIFNGTVINDITQK